MLTSFFNYDVAAVGLVFLLLGIGPTAAWNSLPGASRGFVPSRLDLSANDDSFSWSRREALRVGGAGMASAISLPSASRAETVQLSPPTITSATLLSDYDPTDYKTLPSYGRTVFPPPFLPPLTNRATYRYTLGRDAWALEQLLAFANVTATIRTNVVKLDDGGGLWVCNPLFPTPEYCALLDELGPVTNVVLATNALEHKAAMKQFLFKYPDAEVWISPGQYGPFGECGIVTGDMNEDQVDAIVSKAAKTMGYRVDGVLPVKAQPGKEAQEPKPKNMYPSWIDVFDIAVLCVELPENAGPTSECAFIHKKSRTLVVTDAVICVPSVSSTTAAGGTDSAPVFPLQPIFSTYNFDEATLSNSTFWARTVLQAVFLPLRTESSGLGSEIYPGYEALTNRLVRAPILRAFADARAPDAIREWVNQIASLESFDRIITAHFASPINAGQDLFTKAFAHLDQTISMDELSSSLPPIECQDWSTLNSLNEFIEDNKLGAPVVYDFRRGCKE